MEQTVYEVVIKGIPTSIRNVGQLNDAIRKVNTEFRNSDFGSTKFRELQKDLGRLKGIQQDITRTTKEQTKEFRNAGMATDSIRGLREEAKRLKNILEVLDPNSEEFVRYRSELVRVTREQKKLREEAKKLDRELELEDVDPTSLRGLELTYAKLRAEIKLLPKEAREAAEGIELIEKAASTRAELNKLNQELNDFRTNVGNYPEAAQNAAGALKDVDDNSNNAAVGIRNLATAFGIGFGLNELKSLAQESIQLYDIQIRAEQNLQTALRGREEVVERLLQDASDLQAVTRVGDEAIIEQQAYLAGLGFTEAEIRKLIRTSLDLSEGANLSLESSVKNLAKTYSGLAGELGESVPELRSLSQEQLRNGEAIDIISEKYEGFAEAAAKTPTGRLEQLTNIIGDIKEEFGEDLGEILLNLGEFVSIMAELINIFLPAGRQIDSTAAGVNFLSRSIEILVTGNLKFFSLGLQGLAENAKRGVEIFRDLIQGVDDFTGVFSAQRRLLERLGISFESNSEKSGFFGDTLDRVRKSSSSYRDELQKVIRIKSLNKDEDEKSINSLERLRRKQEEVRQAIIKAVDANDTERVSELRREYQGIEEQIQKFNDALSFQDEQLMKTAEGSLKFYEQQISAINEELQSADPSRYGELTDKLLDAEANAKALREQLEGIRSRLSGDEVELTSIQRITEIDEPSGEEDIQSEILELRKQSQREFLESSKLEQLNFDKEILLSKLNDTDIEFNERLRIADELAAKELEIFRETERVKREERRATFEQLRSVFNRLQEGLTILSDIDSAIIDNRLAKVDERYAREIKLAQGNEERIAKLEKKRDEEKRRIEKAAFERNKAFSIAQAAIQGALAIQNIAATVPKFDFGISAAIQTAFVIGQTIAQIATISAQKFQGERGLYLSNEEAVHFADPIKMAQGGSVRIGAFAKGKRHAEGGIRTSFFGVPVEIEDGEFVDVLEDGGIAVINRRSSSMFASDFKAMGGKIFPGKRKLYSDLNQAGGGIPLAQDGISIGGFTPPLAAIGRESLRQQGQEVRVKLETDGIEDKVAGAVRNGLRTFEDLPDLIGEIIDEKLSDTLLEIDNRNTESQNNV